MASQARGLQNFISDLRNAKSKVRSHRGEEKVGEQCRAMTSFDFSVLDISIICETSCDVFWIEYFKVFCQRDLWFLRNGHRTTQTRSVRNSLIVTEDVLTLCTCLSNRRKKDKELTLSWRISGRSFRQLQRRSEKMAATSRYPRISERSTCGNLSIFTCWDMM